MAHDRKKLPHWPVTGGTSGSVDMLQTLAGAIHSEFMDFQGCKRAYVNSRVVCRNAVLDCVTPRDAETAVAKPKSKTCIFAEHSGPLYLERYIL